MHTETNTTATAPTTSTRRRAPKRPEQLDPATAAATETIAETTAAAKPALSPEVQARLEKERQKLAKEQRQADNRARRIAALERGEELPAPTKGLPQVVKMNELGQVARNLHRAHELLASDEVAALDPTLDAGEAAGCAARLRDLAISTWEAQFAAREKAGATGNETLAPLNLSRDAEGKVTLVIEKKAKSE